LPSKALLLFGEVRSFETRCSNRVRLSSLLDAFNSQDGLAQASREIAVVDCLRSDEKQNRVREEADPVEQDLCPARRNPQEQVVPRISAPYIAQFCDFGKCKDFGVTERVTGVRSCTTIDLRRSEEILQAATVSTRINLFHPPDLSHGGYSNRQIIQRNQAAQRCGQHKRHPASDTHPSLADILNTSDDWLSLYHCAGNVRNFL